MRKHFLTVLILTIVFVIGMYAGKQYVIYNAEIWHDSDYHYMDIDGSVHVYD